MSPKRSIGGRGDWNLGFYGEYGVAGLGTVAAGSGLPYERRVITRGLWCGNYNRIHVYLKLIGRLF